MQNILKQKQSVNMQNCRSKTPDELELPGDVAYGVSKQFSNQARTALRLSHFLSNFLQNVDFYEEYGNLRGDNLLNIELLFGEVLANVMGDLKLSASGIFFDRDKYIDPNDNARELFGPYAWRHKDENSQAGKANKNYRALDKAGLTEPYLEERWFREVKERWQSNTAGLTKFTEKPMIRSDLNGTSQRKFELFPLYYHAPKEEDGWWSPPYYSCGGDDQDDFGKVNDWIVTYSVPFFGKNSIGSALEFKGVVIVDVKLETLDLDQCPKDFYVANAFKNTARCHYESTFCVQIPLPTPERKFQQGGYKCECRQGFEYPFNDRAWYYDGQSMEEEYRKLKNNEQNRFNTLKCRIAASASLNSVTFVLYSMTFLLILKY